VVICWVFFGIILLLSVLPVSSVNYSRWLDFSVFFIYGLVGCLISFLSFISTHPCVFPNYTVIWLHPIHLIAGVMLFVRPCFRFLRGYMLVNGIILVVFLIAWKFIPQEFNPAFVPLVCAICLRSWLYSFKNQPFLRRIFRAK